MGRTASAGTVFRWVCPQWTVQSACAALQVVAIRTGETLRLVLIASQAGTITGLTWTVWSLKQTPECKARKTFDSACRGNNSSSILFTILLTLGNLTNTGLGAGKMCCCLLGSWCNYHWCLRSPRSLVSSLRTAGWQGSHKSPMDIVLHKNSPGPRNTLWNYTNVNMKCKNVHVCSVKIMFQPAVVVNS